MSSKLASKLSYTFKIILLGESGSGKTSLFNRIIYGTAEGNQDPNTPIGDPREPSVSSSPYKNCTKDVRVSGDKGSTIVNVTIFDTGGVERVNYMTLHYYENAQIVCLVYALDSLVSLTSLNAWFEDAKDYLTLKTQHSVAKPVYALVGVKSDIPLDEREVKSAEINGAAKHFDIPEDCCFEVSSISGDGVAEMLQILTQKAYNLHTRSMSTELQNYNSLSKLLVAAPEQPVHRSKRWPTFSLCCCKTRFDEYETIT